VNNVTYPKNNIKLQRLKIPSFAGYNEFVIRIINKMKSTIFFKLQLGFGVSVLILFISSVLSYISIQKLIEANIAIKNTNEIRLDLENVLSYLKDAETGQRGYILTHDNEFLAPYKGAYPLVIKNYNNALLLIKDDSVKQEMIQLKSSFNERFRLLASALQIDSVQLNKNQKGYIAKDVLVALRHGKKIMDLTRTIIDKIEDMQNKLLESRTQQQEKYSLYTPILIVVAALLGLLMTFLSYFRIKKDFETRAVLQDEIEKASEETNIRIVKMENHASEIANGNYLISLEDPKKDELGSLAKSLNKMTGSLHENFTNLKNKEWLQKGITEINDILRVEKPLTELTKNVLNEVIHYTDCKVGAMYIIENDITLKLYSGFALSENSARKTIRIGEGLTGQVAELKKMQIIKELPDNYIKINSALGQAVPKNLAIIPFLINDKLNGIMELGSIREFNNEQLDYLKAIAINISIAINSSIIRDKVQQLLEETQTQTEELQAQQEELEHTNKELEENTERLLASEEELKVQQEELVEANSELEEATQTLEEKNAELEEFSEELERKAEEVQMASKYKSEFLANMSHELRTPLNSILLLSRLLADNKKNNLDKDQLEFAGIINSSGKGLLELINDILDISKIEAGKMEVEIEDVIINEVKEELNGMFDQLAKQKQIDFEITVNKNVPAEIHTDKMRIKQVLKNLLSNSFKFTEEGKVSLEIFMVNGNIKMQHSTNTDEPMIGFSVTDTGIGIPMDKQRLVFEAFQQADGSTKRKYGGTGLGLSISREIAGILGGEIQLHSEEGKGSTFTLYLPLTYVPQQKIEEPTDKAIIKKPITKVEHSEVLNNVESLIIEMIPAEIPDDRDTITIGEKVILIIDDDTKFAKVLLKLIRDKGYKGIVAVRGDYGIKFAQMYQPVGILLDLKLPVMNGWQVMDELKNNSSTKHIPVHMMSTVDVRKEGLSKGAIDFIHKPFASDKVNDIFNNIKQGLKKDNRKTLVLNDDITQAETLASFLTERNIETTVANSANEGLKMLENGNMDCVIINVLNEKATYDLLEEIRTKPEYKNLPILIYTQKELQEEEEKRLKKYADAIIVKTEDSYKRILDETSLFLHVVEDASTNKEAPKRKYIQETLLKGKTILIVDDDMRNVFSLTKTLESQGVKIISAANGQESIDSLIANPETDIVLMDMMMPVMDGYEAIREIRKNKNNSKLPIIAVTAKAMVGDREKCIQAGATDYLSKPIDVDKLISLLRVWLY
jgi:signal transduction histidine kinase/DNA-binding response OmpR family regulator/CHASE3 domain sensor protein